MNSPPPIGLSLGRFQCIRPLEGQGRLRSTMLLQGLVWPFFFFSPPVRLTYGGWLEVFAPNIGKIRIGDNNGIPIWELEEMVLGGETGVEKTTWGRVKVRFK